MIRNYFVVVCLCIIQIYASSQSTSEITIQAGGGYDFNVFNAPELYIPQPGDTIRDDSLLRDAGFTYATASYTLKWKRDKFKLDWSTDGEIRRYAEVGSADATQAQSRLNYVRKYNSKMPYGAWLRLRYQDRLGLNVLGSELLTPFSFGQIETGAFLEKEDEKKNKTKLEFIYSYKDYKECTACGDLGENVSLSQQEIEVSLGQEFILKKIEKDAVKLNLGARFRDREYYDWINYEILSPNPDPLAEEPFLLFDSSTTYLPRAWRYLIFRTDLQMPLSKNMKVKPYIEYSRRYDVSQGDFSFIQLKPGIYFYLKNDAWNMKLNLSYTDRRYDERLAKQENGVPYPTLTYSYIRAKLDVTRQLGKGFSVWASLYRTSRDSNTSDFTTRVRRDYKNADFILGLGWEVKKKREKKG